MLINRRGLIYFDNSQLDRKLLQSTSLQIAEWESLVNEPLITAADNYRNTVKIYAGNRGVPARQPDHLQLLKTVPRYEA